MDELLSGATVYPILNILREIYSTRVLDKVSGDLNTRMIIALLGRAATLLGFKGEL